jgi:hypothetical protein
MKKILDQITREAQDALGLNLVSLVLYGSQARNEAKPGSNINLFLMVKDGSAKDLAVLLKHVPGWIKLGAMPPIIIEQEQFPKSFDTFALEYAEMAAARKILAGEDPFAEFVPDWTAMRNELEREARQKAIGLTQQWLATHGDVEAKRKLIAATVPGYFALLRGMLHLEKRSPEILSYHTILAEIANKRGLDASVWRRLWQVAKEGEKLGTEESRALMRDYLDQARALVEYLDQKKVEG